MIIDRDLKKNKYASFFDGDLAMSSGMKKMISDVNTGTESSQTTAQKQANMLNLLLKVVNIEKFIDLDLTFGIPLPDIKWNTKRFYPSFFYNANAGLSLSVTNEVSGTSPEASTYVRKETKVGTYIIYEDIKNKTEQWRMAFYKLDRADTATSLNYTQLANDGKFFNFSDLKQNHTMYDMDLAYHKQKDGYQYLLEVKELQLMSQSKRKSLYGTSPMLHARYRFNFKGESVHWSPFFGQHYRKWYTLMQGMYVGVHINYQGKGPFEFTGKLSNQFITFLPQFNLSWFRFSYGMKVPYRNPQDNLWVASIHNISLNFPFP